MKNLNGDQVGVIWVVALAAAGMLLFPPSGRPAEYGSLYPEGYRWLLSIQGPSVVDYQRLLFQFIILGLFGVAGVLSLRAGLNRPWTMVGLVACAAVAIGILWVSLATVPMTYRGDFRGWTPMQDVQAFKDAGLVEYRAVVALQWLVFAMACICGAVLVSRLIGRRS